MPLINGALDIIQGIDISHWNGHVDFEAVKNAGFKFVISKATEGLSSVDPFFARNWSETKAHGLIRGAYHFFHPSMDPVAQFAHYQKTVGNIEAGDFGPILDFETANGETRDICINRGADWMNAAEAAYNRLPMFYSYLSFIRDTIGGPTFFGKFPLWLAVYSDKVPICPRPWAKYAMWQYSESAVCPGVPGHCDTNRFYGTNDQFLSFVETGKV